MPESVFIMRSLALTTALAFDQHFVQAGFVTPRL
jgi:predicted nucleic acid-binding protein